MASPALLSANELTLTFGTQKLLIGATLAVGAGEKVGLVGRNGSGKTSLIKLLSGSNEADGGEISRRRGLRVGYLPQDFELDPEATVQRNIEAGAADVIEWMRRYEEGEGSDAELADIQHHIEDADGWHLATRIKSLTTALAAPPLEVITGPLSGGEKRRVALCRALASQPDLLLLDEPTNHLDSESIRWLEGFLRDFKGAVIFITHDRYFLDVIATRIIELDGGRCFSHPGNYTSYLESKAVRQQIASQAERRRQRFLREELDWVRAGVRAQRSKSRGRLDAYYATADLAAPPEEREMDLLIPPAPEMGNTAVILDKAGAKVGEGSSARWLFRHFNLTLRPGQCTGIVGRNGAGKTTLVRLCLGERQPEEGTVTIGKKVVFNSIDQGRMQLRDDSTVLAEVQDSDEVVYFGGTAISARGYLRRFLFPDERANERVSLLSGGERARLMLAKVLKRGGNVLVLDEPTNDLDLSSLRLLEEAIASFDGCVIVVSHDRYFLDRICDQIVGFEENGVFIQPGNFSYYEEKKRQRDLAARQPAPAVAVAAPTPPPVTAPAPKARKLSYKEQRELEGIEATILAAEQRVAELDALLADPAFFITRAVEAPKLSAEAERKRAEIPKLYARWEALGAAAGQA